MPEPDLFHLMHQRHRLAALWMQPDGQHTPALADGQTVETAWPRYQETAVLFADFIAQVKGRELRYGRRAIQPGSADYTRALAQALGKSPLRLWAYVTPATVSVSFRQVALALLRAPTSALRHELETQGVIFAPTSHGHYCVSLSLVTQKLGQPVADAVCLYPRQIGDFLGVRPEVATRLARTLGIAAHRTDLALARWGDVRQVRRVGLRRFELGAA